jgi:hypothetical protein
MCYHYLLHTHCRTCSSVTSSLKTFCVATTTKEAHLRLNSTDECYIGKDPAQYPRKDDVIPGSQYEYYVWGEMECQACEGAMYERQRREQRMNTGIDMGTRTERSQQTRTLRTQTYIPTHHLLEMSSYLTPSPPSPSPKTTTSPAKKAKRALSREERRERKEVKQKLFTDPKALEEQQRLLGEVGGGLQP